MQGDRVFAPQAEDHSSAKTTTGVLLSRPCELLPLPNLHVRLAETSYYSGISDACITFLVDTLISVYSSWQSIPDRAGRNVNMMRELISWILPDSMKSSHPERSGHDDIKQKQPEEESSSARLEDAARRSVSCLP